MKRHVALIVALVSLACGDAPTSPSMPGNTTNQPAGPTFTIRGEVRDTVNLPIPDAQVQVMDGPRAGLVAATDAIGRFVLPGTFSGTLTVRVSKEGFHASQRTVPPPGAPTPPVAPVLRFDLEAIDMPIIIAGNYAMTFSAANECTQLPTVARRRTYQAHVGPDQVRWFAGGLAGDFLPYSGLFYAEVRGEPPKTVRVYVMSDPYGSPPIGIVERIGSRMLLEIMGEADLPLGGREASAAFEGKFAFCEADVGSPEEEAYRCPVQPVTCQSRNHRLTWIRQ